MSEKWKENDLYLETYILKSLRKEKKVTTDQFVQLILSGINCYCKDLKPEGFEKKCSVDIFTKSLFKMKKDRKILLRKLMEETDFYYSNEEYLSDDIDLTLTNFQISQIISFNNPDFYTFEIELKDESSKYFIKDFIELHKNLNITEEKIKHYSEMFLNIYIQEKQKLAGTRS
ncbi:hypothetical protein ES705_44755 [subsurface metagenome]